jgi:hypothetical protein
MDKGTKRSFIEVDKTSDEKIDSKLMTELCKRKDEHYNILRSEEYADIIRNF